jgi:hypothetical protein
MLIYYCCCCFYCHSTILLAPLRLPLQLLQSLDRILLEKLTDSQIVKNPPPPMYGTRGLVVFIEGANCPDHEKYHPSPSLSSASRRFNHLICAYVSKWFLSLRFPNENPVYTSPLPHSCHMPCPSNSSRFDHPDKTGKEYKS